MKKIFFVSFLILIVGLTQNTYPQFFDKLKKKVKQETEKRVEKKTDEGVKKVFDEAENGTESKDKKTEKSGDKKQEPSKKISEKSESSKDDNPTLSANEKGPKLVASSKYDFVPGQKIILFDDFSQDAVGDFPALWTANAPGEINTLNIAQEHWFNLNSGEGSYYFLNNVEFPKNFIIEFDIVPKKVPGRVAMTLILYGEDKHKEMDNDPYPGNRGIKISIEKANWFTTGYKKGEGELLNGSSTINPVEPEKVNHVIIWVQNRRFRIYHKGAKVLDMPTNVYDGTNFNRFCFRLYRGVSCGSYISNFRITDASPDIRSKLLTEGKIISYGIYFDVNSDKIKPESSGTLKEISTVLQDNPDIKIKIVGYTDSDGDDKSNLDLSKRRAASVKNALVESFSIDGARIETDGKGEGEPIVPNDNTTNKALNRRVEFIKL